MYAKLHELEVIQHAFTFKKTLCKIETDMTGKM